LKKRGQPIGCGTRRDATRCTLLNDAAAIPKRRRGEATGMSLEVCHNRRRLNILARRIVIAVNDGATQGL
jgi:hypothetical protein